MDHEGFVDDQVDHNQLFGPLVFACMYGVLTHIVL